MGSTKGVFGRVYGDLPLLHLNAKAMLKLRPDDKLALREQIKHNCIRRAWVDATVSGAYIRDALDLRVARAYQQWEAIVGGGPLSGYGLSLDMDRARHTNERETCFGFFLLGEIQHLVDYKRPGPILRSTLPSNFGSQEERALTSLSPEYSDRLQLCLDNFREHVLGSSIASETVDWVVEVTGQESCLTSLPDEVRCYFHLVKGLQEMMSSDDFWSDELEAEAEDTFYSSWKLKTL